MRSKNMWKSICALTLCVSLGMPSQAGVYAAEIQSKDQVEDVSADVQTEHVTGKEGKRGEMGEHIKWSYDQESKKLVISGTGDMCDDNVSIFCPYVKEAETVEIKQGITHIGEYAFQNCGRLTEVTIPSGVETIGDSAFYNCTRLEKVNMQSGVKKIGDDAFEYCKSLKEVNLPSSVERIGKEAFRNCSSLKNVGDLSNVSRIGEAAFYKCTKLQSAALSPDLKNIQAETFYRCTSLKEIQIPSGVEEIGTTAFSECGALEKVTISSGVQEIGREAFSKCEKLETVTAASEMESIGEKAFLDCKALKNLDFSQGVKSIDDQAFSGCSALESVKFSSGLTYIGSDAFLNCTSLKEMNIPAEVKRIDWMAFENCSNLECITVDEENQNYSSKDGSLYSKDGKTLIRASAKISEFSEQVINIGDGAFSGLQELSSVALLDGLKKIGYRAFKDCKNLQELEIPKSVTEIGRGVFLGCTNLQKVIIPDRVDFLDDTMFSDCENLQDIFVESGNNAYKMIDGSLYTKDGKSLIRASAKEKIEIPQGVVSIKAGSFSGVKKLKTIQIPSSVKKIEDKVFSECSQLTDIVVDKQNETYQSVNGSLYNKSKTTLIRAAAAESITLPKEVKKIDQTAFLNCPNLTKFLVDKENKTYQSVDGNLYSKDGTELIQVSANITSFEVPALVTFVDEDPFSNCSKLTKIAIHRNTRFLTDEKKNWTIYCETGSDAEKEAKKKGFTVKQLHTFPGELKTIQPSKVTGLKKTSCKKDQIAISWKTQSGVSGYEVWCYNTKTRKQTRKKVTGEKKHTLVIQRLNADTLYEISVKAFHKTKYGTAYGSYSDTLKIKTKK